MSKVAEIIETEFGIRALQAALVERRNRDRVGHVFCNLRLIIVPEGAARGEAAREPAPSSPSRPPSNPGAGRRGERELRKEAHELEHVFSTGQWRQRGHGWGRA